MDNHSDSLPFPLTRTLLLEQLAEARVGNQRWDTMIMGLLDHEWADTRDPH